MNAKTIGVSLVAFLILFLLWKRGGNTTIVEEQEGPTVINIKSGDVVTYEIPPYQHIDIGEYKPTSFFDWMQTTNMICSCDTDYKPQVPVEVIPPPQRATAISYVFLSAPAPTLPPYNPPPALAPTILPVYTPPVSPPPPTRDLRKYFQIQGGYYILSTGERLKTFANTGFKEYKGFGTYKGETYFYKP